LLSVVEPDPESLPELLAELQGQLQEVLGTRDRRRGLLEAVVARCGWPGSATTRHHRAFPPATRR
jgi:hypothetical protein